MGILQSTCVRDTLEKEKGKCYVTHATSNAQCTPAVAAAKLVIAETFKKQISTETANVEHSNASSASQADEKGRYVS